VAHKAQPAPAVSESKLSLPSAVTGPADINRLIRELSMISDSLLQLGLRSSGTTVKMPQTSHLMDQIIGLNKLNLLKSTDRQTLKRYLATVQTKAPVLHISFSTDPAPAFIEKLMTWLRRELHPQILLTIGLQPNIGAGCILRTTNKYFDLSLRQTFTEKRKLLLQELSAREAPA
jgi:F0F1-type ATP synthase delta subunit